MAFFGENAGITAIRCKGVYEETGKTGFGEGSKSASDFDGTDLLKSGAVLAMIAAGSFVAGCLEEKNPEEKNYLLFNGTKPKETEPAPIQIVKPVHISEFTFGKDGEVGEVRNGFTNESYQIKFTGIWHEHVPIPRGIGTVYTARISIADLNTSETKSIVLGDGASVDIDKNLNAYIDVGSNYAKLSIREVGTVGGK